MISGDRGGAEQQSLLTVQYKSFRNDADQGRTAVRFANGLAQTRSKFLFWSSWPTPDAGSVITGPAKPPQTPIDRTQLITSLVAITGSVLATIVVIVR